jgi:hypothetical protein
VAVAGATDAVGNEMLSILEERNFPVDQLKLLVSTRGAGAKKQFKGKEYTVEVMTENSFAGMDIGLFSPGGSVSDKFALIAGIAGCVVIDNPSAFRMDPHISGAGLTKLNNFGTKHLNIMGSRRDPIGKVRSDIAWKLANDLGVPSVLCRCRWLLGY